MVCSVGASECIQPRTEEQFVDVPVRLQGILTVEVVEQIQVAGGEDNPCSSTGASVALSMGLGRAKVLVSDNSHVPTCRDSMVSTSSFWSLRARDALAICWPCGFFRAMSTRTWPIRCVVTLCWIVHHRCQVVRQNHHHCHQVFRSRVSFPSVRLFLNSSG